MHTENNIDPDTLNETDSNNNTKNDTKNTYFSPLSLAAGTVTALMFIILIIAIKDDFFGEPLTYGESFAVMASCCCLAIIAGLTLALNIPLPSKAARVMTVILYFAAPAGALVLSECIQNVNPCGFTFETLICSYIVFFMLYSAAALITGELRIPVIAVTLIILIFSIAARNVIELRGTPLMPADLMTIGTGMNVMSNYNLVFSWSFIPGILTALEMIILAVRLPALPPVPHARAAVRISGAAVILAAAIPFYTTNIADANGIRPDFWDQSRGYRTSGTVLNFMLNTKYLFITRPDNYDAGDIPNIIEDLINSAENDYGILHSAEMMQNTLGITSLSAEKANIDVSDPDDDTDPPNTGIDTHIAVQDTSDTDQPVGSAVLADGQIPDIIAVMNETYADLRVLGELSTNMDYMPFTRNLTENTIKGNLYMPVMGAGTSNSEFEFLTGCSTSFLPGGSIVFQLYINDRMPSLVSHLSQLDFSVYGFHPYFADSWRRNEVYPLLGFEKFISLEDIIGEELASRHRNGSASYDEYRITVENMFPDDDVLIRRFFSDSFDYKLIERMYEERGDSKPFFMFNVTMQNHGGYDTAYANFNQKIRITNMPAFYPQASRYLSLIYESDRAFRELVEYFSSIDHPVILLMFGDHQPNLETDFFEELIGSSITELDMRQRQSRYVTPFIIWANFDIEEGYIDKMSSNYLSTLLLQTAGLKTTAYNDYLSALYMRLPVIDTTGFIDASGRYYSYDESSEYAKLLSDYRNINYNYIFDIANRRDKQLFEH